MICPICKNTTFENYNGRHLIKCTNCGSLERHRLLYLYLKNETSFFTATLNVLHFSPEPFFVKIFKPMKNMTYLGINNARGQWQVDMMQTPFDDNLFDMVIAIHVLPEVKDDIKAMSDMYRILNAEGLAILNVPDFRSKTIENSTEPLYYRHYAQNDYIKRLKSVGFNVSVNSYANKMDSKYNLQLNENIYLCRKK